MLPRRAPGPTLLLLLLVMALAGWSRDPELAERVRASLERTVEGCLDSPLLSIDGGQVWFLRQARAELGPSTLDPVVERLAEASWGDMAILARPDADPPVRDKAYHRRIGVLPELLGRLQMLMHDSVACARGGAPSERLREYVAADLEGYALTHQVLAILWAREVGCAMPAAWEARLPELARKVESELERPAEFGDLFTERVALVAHVLGFDRVRPSWVETLLAAQGQDGCWTADDPIVLEMDGRSGSWARKDRRRTHATVMAVFVLAGVLERVG